MAFRAFPLEAVITRLHFEEERYRIMLGVNLAQEERIRAQHVSNAFLRAQNETLRTKVARQQQVIGWKFYWMIWWSALRLPRWDGLWICIGMAIGAVLVVIVATLLFLGFVGARLQASMQVRAYSDAGISQIYDLYGIPAPRQTPRLAYPPTY